MFCTKCGEELKLNAKFCHQCGEQAGGDNKISDIKKSDSRISRSWRQLIGPFLFIPLFAAIVILLFWNNREAKNVHADNSGNNKSLQNAAVMNDVHRTLKRLKANVESNPKDLVSIDSLAVMFWIAGSYEKSKEYYSMHLQIEPDNKEIKVAFEIASALLHQQNNESEKAVAILQVVLEEDPANSSALYCLAEIQSVTHQHDEANKNWQKLIEIYPGTDIAIIAKQRLQEKH